MPNSTRPAPRRTLALIVGIVVVVLVGFGSFWISRGGPIGGATTTSAIAGPTAVPTLDFFRGKSYPTPTPPP